MAIQATLKLILAVIVLMASVVLSAAYPTPETSSVETTSVEFETRGIFDVQPACPPGEVLSGGKCRTRRPIRNEDKPIW